MNVFVLCTGRCGSMSFAKACEHITNFTASHESRVSKLGTARLSYPENHIEVDNRLAWMLGRLWQLYPSAKYVWLKREDVEVVRSYDQRWLRRWSIVNGYRHIVPGALPSAHTVADMVHTVNWNIMHFLNSMSPHQFFIAELETIRQDFCRFWDWVGAEGSLQGAIGEFDIKHNATEPR